MQNILTYMKNILKIYAKYMENIRNIYGKYTQNICTYMESICDSTPWHICGIY